MPHFIVEYSANIEPELDVPQLLDLLTDAAVATGVFNVPGVRARAMRRDFYRIADGHPDNAFIHVNFRIGAGRDLETQKQVGQAIFDKLTAYLGKFYDERAFMLSFEITELHPDLNFKKSNIRDHLAARQSKDAAQ